ASGPARRPLGAGCEELADAGRCAGPMKRGPRSEKCRGGAPRGAPAGVIGRMVSLRRGDRPYRETGHGHGVPCQRLSALRSPRSGEQEGKPATPAPQTIGAAKLVRISKQFRRVGKCACTDFPPARPSTRICPPYGLSILPWIICAAWWAKARQAVPLPHFHRGAFVHPTASPHGTPLNAHLPSLQNFQSRGAAAMIFLKLALFPSYR